jgi:Protein of unknown function (DUF3574)
MASPSSWGNGQWRSGDGRIYREGVHVLLILFKADAEGRVEQSGSAYKGQFRQEDLRVDTTVCAAF